jgi:hypothetical protein
VVLVPVLVLAEAVAVLVVLALTALELLVAMVVRQAQTPTRVVLSRIQLVAVAVVQQAAQVAQTLETDM